MTRVREQVALAPFTTLGLGGPARRLATAETEAELIAAVEAADARGEPLLVLGGGSNLVIPDDGFPGTVVRVASTGIHPGAGTPGTQVTVTVAAGEDWDGVVAWSVAEGLAGLECLSGIPGRAGATPIQNVGAYGQEVSGTATTVRAYDRQARAVVELAADGCGFGYRDSVFKHSPFQPRPSHPGAAPGQAGVTGRFVVLAVAFALARTPLSQPVRYRELARTLGVAEGGRAPLAEVRAAVLGLRRGKGMVLDPADPDTRSAGSFFTNPALSQQKFAELTATVAATCGPGVQIPRFPAAEGQVKVPAAWLIERAGFSKGYPGGPDGPAGKGARISTKHTLALVNPGEATTSELIALAREIRDGVRQTFGIELAPEPMLVGATL